MLAERPLTWPAATGRHGPSPTHAQTSEKTDGKSIQSVDRALSIIEALSLSPSPLMLSEIAKLVGLNLSTCHHLIMTMVKRGYVVYAGRSSGYLLSSKLEAVANLSVREFNLVEFVRPRLQQLNVDLREATQMAVVRGSALVTHIRLASHIAPQVDIHNQASLHAAHALASGKAILAWLPGRRTGPAHRRTQAYLVYGQDDCHAS